MRTLPPQTSREGLLTSAVDKLVSAIEAKTGRSGKRVGRATRLLCPAHDDHSPSLDVSEGESGGAIVQCRSHGCSYEQVLAAVGLNPADLAGANGAVWTPAGDAVRVYDYTDEGGRVLFQVCRTADKQFIQRVPDASAKSGWRWKLGDTRRVLYRLPDVLQAAARGATIYVCEGEKDVEAIERAGGVATCNPMGAGKWQPEYAEMLRGATVLIVRDLDDPGRKHAAQVRASLDGVAASVTIVDPLEGKDAADHLAAGLGLDDFEQPPPNLNVDQPDVAPARTALELETWLEFRGKAADHIPCLIDDLWPENSLGFIASPPKKGKTWIGLSLALSITLGTSFLHDWKATSALPVLYIALEGHRSALMHRVSALLRGHGRDPAKTVPGLTFNYKPAGINIADPEWAEQILLAAQQIEARLIIVDVLRAAARIKENDASEFSGLRANLAPILDDQRSIALLHHFTKLNETTKERSPAERMSGTGAMYGAMDIGIFITGSEDGARKLRLEFDSRDIATPDTHGIYLEGEGTGPNGGFTQRDKAWWRPGEIPGEDQIKAPAEEIADYIRNQRREVSRAELLEHFEISSDTLNRRAKDLEFHGINRVLRAGGKTSYHAPGYGQQEME